MKVILEFDADPEVIAALPVEHVSVVGDRLAEGVAVTGILCESEAEAVIAAHDPALGYIRFEVKR